MHRCGWVHRDISIANVMLDSTGRGRLVDLEYAKRQDSEPEGFLVSMHPHLDMGLLIDIRQGNATLHGRRGRETRVHASSIARSQYPPGGKA